MATKSTLSAQIEDDLDRTDLTSQVTRAIDYSIEHYAKDRFWFNEANNQSVSLTSSIAELALTALPVKLLEIDRLRIKLSSTTYLDMYPRDYDWIQSRQDTNLTAQPIEYCIYAEKLQFDSYADTSYTLVLDGIKSLGNAASDTYSAASAVAWFNEARDLIRAAAKRDLYAHVIKDFEMATAMKTVEDMEYNRLKGRTNRLKSTGAVRPTNF